MDKIVPDGEYDVDFSGLFSKDSNIFGIKFGFKPDTIDESYPSYLYKDSEINVDQNSDKSKSFDFELPCYLVSESKENSKAITTNHNKDDHLYFEGRSKFNFSKPLNSSKISSPKMDSSNNDEMNPLSEFLLSFDDVSKTFKIDYFNGFIKMNKSRELELVSSKIEKCKKYTDKSFSENSQSYIDSIISLYSTLNSKLNLNCNLNMNSLKKSSNNNFSSSVLSNDKTKSYGKSISGISPVKKSSVHSPLQSPTRITGSLSPSLSIASNSSSSSLAATVPSIKSVSTETSKISPSLLTSQPIQLAHKTQIPIIKPSSPLKNSSTDNKLRPVNGGTGLKKTHKSLLLRKAERSIGINNNNSYRISKPKLKDNGNSLNNNNNNNNLNNSKSDNVNDINHLNLTKRRESLGLRIRQREIKEARPDQTEFELVLTPPPLNISPNINDKVPNMTNKISNSVKKENTRISKIKVNKISEEKENNTTLKPALKNNNINSKIDKGEKQRNKISEESEGNLNHDDYDDEEDKTIKIKPLKLSNHYNKNTDNNIDNSKLNKNTEDNQISNISNEDFNLEFSDWEDADAIDGPVLSDETELTAGPNDFQVIIEDDPFKNKRENEMKMREEKKKEKLINNSHKDSNELNKKSKLKTKSNEKSTEKLKNFNETTKIIKDNTKPKITKITKTSNKTIKNSKMTKNSKDEKNAIHEDDEIDRELDAELNKAFDDMLDEEDMSEEE